MRFSADDACMDVTQSHTVNIATHNLYAESGHLQNEETGLPKYKGMKPANTQTFNKSLIFLFFIFFFKFIIFTYSNGNLNDCFFKDGHERD